MSSHLKQSVKAHWEAETCGTRYGESKERREWLRDHALARYKLEPHVRDFADFAAARGQRVLEIGVGAGVDFTNWIWHGAQGTGIDLTKTGVDLTRERLEAEHLDPESYTLQTADAEKLPFQDGTFDLVYSWGVLHHTPDTEKAFREAFRVLKPGGTLKAMIYHRPSWTGFLLWIRYALLAGRPLASMKEVMARHLESPGTKAYTLREARALLQKVGFHDIELSTKLCAGDLLTIKPSEKYQSFIYKLIWRFYPRWLVKALGDRWGLELLMKARK